MVTTKRQVFFSFDYKPDVFRVSQIREMGSVEDKPLLSSNEWEEVKKGNDPAIKKWIDDNMKNRSCVVVLVGENTANKKWVQYEIEKAWNDRKGLVGIHIHNLNCPITGYANKGTNPFELFTLNEGKIKLSEVIECYDPLTISIASLYDPTLSVGQIVYRDIKDKIEGLVEKAINIRNNY